MRNFCLACLIFAVLSSPCRAEESRYIVTYVYDGDTVKLHPANTFSKKADIKLRLTDIDAPERNQPFGLKSRRALIKLCQGKNILVTTRITGRDKYHRALGKLQCNYQDASLYMVKNGHAWFYHHYSSDSALSLAEQAARKNKLGLWQNPQQTPPWVWRKNHPH